VFLRSVRKPVRAERVANRCPEADSGQLYVLYASFDVDERVQGYQESRPEVHVRAYRLASQADRAL